MKKLIVTIAALALSLGAFAQINFGVKVGGNLATISNMVGEGGGIDWGGESIASHEPSQSMRLGFNAGVYAEYMVMPMLGIQVEANFSMQGVNTKTETNLGEYSSAVKSGWSANYVNIPILAKLHLGPIRAFAGPQLGFATGLNTKIKTTIGDNTNVQEQPVEGYNTFDLSLVLGAQYKLTANIGVDARYNIGLTNVFPETTDGDGEVLTEGWGKQGVLQVGVFYEF